MIDSLLLNHRGALISVKIKDSDLRQVMEVENIICIRTSLSAHYLIFTFVNQFGQVKSFETRSSIAYYSSILPNHFVNVDKGLIVNIHYIDTYSEKGGAIIYRDFKLDFVPAKIDLGRRILEVGDRP